MATLSGQVKQIYEGYTNLLKERLGILPEWILKLAKYRMTKCQPCVLNGECPHCKCLSPALFFAPSKEDALKKWGPIPTEEAFHEFEKTTEYQDYIKEYETTTNSTKGLGIEGITREGEQSTDNEIPPSS